jgi:hypothetical protein
MVGLSRGLELVPFPGQRRWETVAKMRVSHRVTPDYSEANELVTRIKHQWGDTREANLYVAQLIIQLNPPKVGYDAFGLPFQYSWAKRLKKIGECRHLNDESYRDELPHARRTLYEIALLTERQFSEARDDGLIHDRVTAKEIELWRKRKLPRPSYFDVHLRIRPISILPKSTRHIPEFDEAVANEIIMAFREHLYLQAGCELWMQRMRNAHQPEDEPADE